LSLDFQLYTHVEHNRTLVHSQASAILSFIQGKYLITNKSNEFCFKDWINGSNDNHSYSCVMSCSNSILGLTESNEEEQTNKNLICSVPILMKGQDEIIPQDLNLSNDNRTALTRIIKVCISIKFNQYHFFFFLVSYRTCKPNTK
jgi:hypothetical protein